jgi:hypothetical protein
LECSHGCGQHDKRSWLLLFNSVRANVSTTYRISFACAPRTGVPSDALLGDGGMGLPLFSGIPARRHDALSHPDRRLRLYEPYSTMQGLARGLKG